MKYEHLQTLHAIVEAGSFKSAAEKLFKTQPAVSLAIKELEKEVDFEIFSRSGYRAVLTQKGDAFYREVKHIIQDMQDLNLYAEHLAMDQELEVTITVDALCPMMVILDYVRPFFNEHAHTKLHIETLYGH